MSVSGQGLPPELRSLLRSRLDGFTRDGASKKEGALSPGSPQKVTLDSAFDGLRKQLLHLQPSNQVAAITEDSLSVSLYHNLRNALSSHYDDDRLQQLNLPGDDAPSENSSMELTTESIKNCLRLVEKDAVFAIENLVKTVLMPSLTPLYSISLDAGIVSDVVAYHLLGVLRHLLEQVRFAQLVWEKILNQTKKDEQDRLGDALEAHSKILQVLCMPFDVSPQTLLDMFRESESAKSIIFGMTKSHQQQLDQQAALDKGEYGYSEAEDNAQVLMLKAIHRLKRMSAVTAVKEAELTKKRASLLSVSKKIAEKAQKKTNKDTMATLSLQAFKMKREADKLESVRSNLVTQTLSILEQHAREVQDEIEKTKGLLLSEDERKRLEEERSQQKKMALDRVRREAAIQKLERFLRWSCLFLRFERRRRTTYAVTIQCAYRLHSLIRRVKARVRLKAATVLLAVFFFTKFVAKRRLRQASANIIIKRLRQYVHRKKMRRIIHTTLLVVKNRAMRLTRDYYEMVTSRFTHLESLVLALQPSTVASSITELIANDFDRYEVILEACDEGNEDEASKKVSLKKKHDKKKNKKAKAKALQEVDVDERNIPLWQELSDMRNSLGTYRQRLDLLDSFAESIKMGIRTSMRMGALSQKLGLDKCGDLLDDDVDGDDFHDDNKKSRSGNKSSSSNNVSGNGRRSSANLHAPQHAPSGRNSSANLHAGFRASSTNLHTSPQKPHTNTAGLSVSTSKSVLSTSNSSLLARLQGQGSSSRSSFSPASTKVLGRNESTQSKKQGSKKSRVKLRVRTFSSTTSHLYRGLPVTMEAHLTGEKSNEGKSGEDEEDDDYGLEGLYGPREEKGQLYPRMVQFGGRVDPAVLLSVTAQMARQSKSSASSSLAQRKPVVASSENALALKVLQLHQRETKRAYVNLAAFLSASNSTSAKLKMMSVTTGLMFFHGQLSTSEEERDETTNTTTYPKLSDAPRPADSLLYKLGTETQKEPSISDLAKDSPVPSFASLVGCDLVYGLVAPFILFEELHQQKRPSRPFNYLEEIMSNVLSHMSLCCAMQGLLPTIDLLVPNNFDVLGWFPLRLPVRSHPPPNNIIASDASRVVGLGSAALHAFIFLGNGLAPSCGPILSTSEIAEKHYLPSRRNVLNTTMSAITPSRRAPYLNVNELGITGSYGGGEERQFLPIPFLLSKSLELAYSDKKLEATLDIVAGFSEIEDYFRGKSEEEPVPGGIKLMALFALATTSLSGVAEEDSNGVSAKIAFLQQVSHIAKEETSGFLIFASYFTKVLALVHRHRSEEDHDSTLEAKNKAAAAAVLDPLQLPSSGAGAGLTLVPEGSAAIHADVVAIPKHVDLPTVLDSLQYIYGIPLDKSHSPSSLIEKLYVLHGNGNMGTKMDASFDTPEAREMREAVDVALSLTGVSFRTDFSAPSNLNTSESMLSSAMGSRTIISEAQDLAIRVDDSMSSSSSVIDDSIGLRRELVTSDSVLSDHTTGEMEISDSGSQQEHYGGLSRAKNTLSSPLPPSDSPSTGALTSPLRMNRSGASILSQTIKSTDINARNRLFPLAEKQAAETLGLRIRQSTTDGGIASAGGMDRAETLAAAMELRLPIVVRNVQKYNAVKRVIDFATTQHNLAAQMLDKMENKNLETFSEGEEEDEEEDGGESGGETDGFGFDDAKQDRNMTLYEMNERQSSLASGSTESAALRETMQVGDTVHDYKSFLLAATVDPIALAFALYPLHAEQGRRVHEYVEISRVFRFYDSDNAGFINKKQFDALCLDIRCGSCASLVIAGAKLGTEDANDLFHKASLGTGKIDFAAFRWVTAKLQKLCA